MSSLTRRMQRKRARSKAAAERPEPTPQVILMGEMPYTGGNPAIRRLFDRALEGGYVTIRYTRGARRVSARRLRAQAVIAQLQAAAQMRFMSRPAKLQMCKNDIPQWRNKSIWPAAKVARRAQAVA